MTASRCRPWGAVLGVVGLLVLASGARADDGRRGPTGPWLPAYRQACADCHVAYPPGLLPAESWVRLMNGLPRHFGSDASLDPASVAELSAWLSASAATSRRVRTAPPEDRITRSTWFARTHRELPATTWTRPAVKSPANCSACHPRADQGVFDEHDIRIPR